MPPLSKTPTPSWDAASIKAGIAQTRFANRIHHLPLTTSTSTLALEAAHSGAHEGQVWVADEQTAGRGRGGHTWHSEPRAGLYFSILLRPTLPPEKALWLSLLTGLAVQSAVTSVTGLQPDLRWPNDLLLNEKKFGGILVETAIKPDQPPTLRHAVVGIGINVAHTTLPPELQPIATSLFLETRIGYSRERLLTAILVSLHEGLRDLDAELSATSTPTLLDRFTRASTWVKGKQVQVGENGGYIGITDGLDPNGFLCVHGHDGIDRIILSGGVRSSEPTIHPPKTIARSRF